MSIRLSGAQVTRIIESINRCAEMKERGYRGSRFVPEHVLIEDLVEDILKEVLPCPTNTPQTPNAQPNANG